MKMPPLINVKPHYYGLNNTIQSRENALKRMNLIFHTQTCEENA
jgi:hypothetical protein